MDTDQTNSSCSWLWEEDSEFKNECCSSHWTKEEDKAFENALALYHNDADRWDKIALAVTGKTTEDVKLHYEALSDDVLAIESGKVPLAHYPSNESDHGKKKKTLRGVNRGIPWTEEEHRRFLDGLKKYGRGDWKSIARFSVQTKSNSQVASHAQKYFKRLNSASKNGKRHSINDITIDHPEPTPLLDKPTANTTPGNNDNAPEKKCLNPTSFGSMSIPPFPSETIAHPRTSVERVAEYDMFTPRFSSHTIQEPDSVRMSTYYPPFSLMQETGVPPPASFEYPTTSKTELLMHDTGVPTPDSFGIPVISEIQTLIQDSVVPTLDSFGFPFDNEIQPAMQESEVHSGSFDIPHVSDVQPLVLDGGAPSLDIPSTPDIQQPLVHKSGVFTCSSYGIPSTSSQLVDLDVFVLPHFLD